MLRNLFTLLLMVGFVLVSYTNAQKANRVVAKKAPVVMNENSYVPGLGNSFTPVPAMPTAANYVAVDTMANAFGPAIGVLNPIAYDPGSNVLALVHRGTTATGGSGTIVYNISTDQGATWSRVGVVNATATQRAGRYPSMAISNPTGGDISATTGVFSWPELVAGAFGGAAYGADQPLGANATFAAFSTSELYRSQVLSWVSDNSPKMYWGSDNQTDASYKIWMTEDFGTIDTFVFPSSVFTDGGNICLGGASGGGNTYIGMLGTFPDPAGSNPIVSGWYPAVSKKSATGAEWDAFEVVDFRTIPALSRFDRLFDYIKEDAFVSYGGDINVDAAGFPHLILTLTDTTTSNNNGVNAIVEIFKTASGWDGRVIYEGVDEMIFTNVDGLALGQMGPSPYLSRSADGLGWAAQWVNKAANDTLCDIYMSTRGTDGVWSAPMNLTETVGMNENSSHFSNMVAGSAGNYKAFSFYTYTVGSTAPDPDETLPAMIWVAPVPFTVVVGVEDENNAPLTFNLDQNYPNPFNPSTQITFNLSKAGNVSLKVFDVLGREVANLINSELASGSHTVNFDASDLASGLYVYRLEAGNMSATRKMMLMK